MAAWAEVALAPSEGAKISWRRRGHAYTADALWVAMSASTEDALWAAMPALEEKSACCAARLRAPLNAGRQYQQEAQGYDQHAQTIGKILVQNQGLKGKSKKWKPRSCEAKSALRMPLEEKNGFRRLLAASVMVRHDRLDPCPLLTR